MSTRIMTLLAIIAVTICSGSIDSHAQWAIGSGAQTAQSRLPKSSIDLKSMSLLDPERFTMKQQTIMSYSSSSMSGGNLLGMYVNTMEYRFNMPLTMRMKVAYQNNMGSLFSSRSATGGQPGADMGRLFIPSVDLIYQPWENTSISLHYRDYSGLVGNGTGYSGLMGSRYSRYYSDPFGLYR